MRLVRLHESSEEINELFGRKKKNKNKKSAAPKENTSNRVKQEVFTTQNVKKWLGHSRYSPKQLADNVIDVIRNASVTLEGSNRELGVALYYTKGGDSMVVASGTNLSNNSVGELWVKQNLYSGEGRWLDIYDQLLKCEDMNDVKKICRKYKFTDQVR